MENKIATTIEQSKKLVELGLNADTADMNYCNASYKGKNYVGEWKLSLQSPQEAKSILDKSVTDWNTYWEIIPAWSLTSLMNILPAFIYSDNKKYDLYISKDFDENGYFYSIKYLHELYGNLYTAFDKCFIDAIFKIIVELKENKLI